MSDVDGSAAKRPLSLMLSYPGQFIRSKINQFKRSKMETSKRRVTEKELMHLNTKIDKLLNKLEENEPELAASQDEECVICVNAKATMQTSPCGHRVVCRKCFVKTIQMAVSQRLLPLRCVICRAKILRLRHTTYGGRLTTSKSWQLSSSSGTSTTPRWGVTGSVSCYSMGSRASVPPSASLYSVTSGESSISGLSSVSSASNDSCNSKSTSASRSNVGNYVTNHRPPQNKVPPNTVKPPQSTYYNIKLRPQDYQVHTYTGISVSSARLPPIREFQREFREGRRESSLGPHPKQEPTVSGSSRIRCAQKIVTQLEAPNPKQSVKKTTPFFRSPLRRHNKDDGIVAGPSTQPKKSSTFKLPFGRDDSKKVDDKSKKEDSNESKKNESLDKKKEEKLKQKAETEAKKEAKKLAKEEEKQAKLLAKEEKKKAKKEAKEAKGKGNK